MDNYQLLFLFILSVLTFRTTCHSPDDRLNGTSTHTHSRRKRYVVFPEGSTYSVAFCLQWGLFSNDNNIFTEAVNWALSYDLPNATIRTPDTKRLVVPYILRRNRRDLYQSLEVAMSSAGLEGRTCIERGLCEAAQRLKPRGSLGEEILRVVFLLPPDKVEDYEPVEHYVYDAAYRRGLSNQDCSDIYSDCPFSLIDVFLGINQNE